MLHTADDLKACKIQSIDGDFGEVHDLYFDDEAWVIRYFVIATKNWFFKREALISPISISKPDWLNKTLQVDLSQKQVDHCPDISVHQPVSRQQEIKYFGYYGYPIYWAGNGLWGQGLYPGGLMLANANIVEEVNAEEANALEESQDNDPHLRSWEKVKGFVVNGSDGEIGHIQGLLVDDKTFAIRYVIVRANDWWIGHDIVISPQWFEGMQWTDSSVKVNHTRADIKSAPIYDSMAKMDRHWEIEMHNHYGRMGYWDNKVETSQQQKNSSTTT